MDVLVLRDRAGEIVHVVTDPAEARRWLAEDRALEVDARRVVLRVGETIEIA